MSSIGYVSHTMSPRLLIQHACHLLYDHLLDYSYSQFINVHTRCEHVSICFVPVVIHMKVLNFLLKQAEVGSSKTQLASMSGDLASTSGDMASMSGDFASTSRDMTSTSGAMAVDHEVGNIYCSLC